MDMKQCKNCLMDETAKEIEFDINGVCNFCHTAQEALKAQEKEKSNWPKIKDWVLKNKGEYDCIIGLSGGVDSSYALVKLVEEGFKPFCFTVDNGWNSPNADSNIMKLVETLEVPLEKIVLDDEFRKLQMAFIKAGVKNIEIPTDHVLMAISYKIAKKHNIKWIISGGNVETESIMPASWGYSPLDLKHIKAIGKGVNFSKIPTCNLFKYNLYKWVNKIRVLYILDYIGYNRDDAIKYLKDNFDYIGYGEKHCESIFTQWFQNYYLQRFGIDKRKAHYSSMINSGQMTKQEAEKEIAKIPEHKDLMFKICEQHEYTDYPTNERLFNFISKIIKFLKDRGIIKRYLNIV